MSLLSDYNFKKVCFIFFVFYVALYQMATRWKCLLNNPTNTSEIKSAKKILKKADKPRLNLLQVFF